MSKRSSKKRANKQNRRIPQSPLKRFWRAMKRIILFCSALLFCGFAYAAYSELHGTFSTRTGQAFTWSAGAAMSPLVKSLPWWFWAGLVSMAIYLWYKHKLVMSIMYGIMAGIYLAVL